MNEESPANIDSENTIFLSEPNLPPLRLRDSGSSDDSNTNPNILNVDDYRQEMAPLPAQTRSILVNKHQLGLAKAARLLEDPDSLKVFLEVMQIDPSNPGISADYILSELEYFRKKFQHETIIDMALTPSHLAGVDTNWIRIIFATYLKKTFYADTSQ